MLSEAVLVEAWQEGELVARRGVIEDRLRIFARLDLILGGEEGAREQEGEETHLGLEIGLGLGAGKSLRMPCGIG